MHGASLVATEQLACLAADPSDPVLGRVRSWADVRDLRVTVTPLGETPEIQDPTATVGLSVGGDGTFLEAVRAFAPRGVPVAGINRGTLSFLARIFPDELSAALAEMLTGRARVRERQRFAVTGGGLHTAGINDVMLEPLSVDEGVRTCQVEAFVGGEYLGRYTGGGVTVSTPTGSTAMALSADGPVHGTGDDTLQVTALTPSRMGVRPVVFAADRTLSLAPTGSVRVTVDGGRAVTTVAPGDRLRVTGADRSAHVVRTSRERSFVAALCAKLGWSLRPEADSASSRDDPPTHDRDRWAGTTQADWPPSARGEPDRQCPAGPESEFTPALRVACRGATAAGSLVARYADEHGHSGETAATAERRAEAVLVTTVDRSFPTDRVHTGEDLPGGRVWLLDGIDGITNFEHGNPSYCTSAALVVDGDPVVGVVYVPSSGELFAAHRGGRAYRNGARIEPTGRDRLDESMLLSGYDPDGAFLRTCYRHARGVRRVGSQALNLCFVAAGSADACWEYDTHPRDAAAGLCILRAAGGRATTPLEAPFELAAGERTPLLVSNGSLHPALLGLVDGGQVQ